MARMLSASTGWTLNPASRTVRGNVSRPPTMPRFRWRHCTADPSPKISRLVCRATDGGSGDEASKPEDEQQILPSDPESGSSGNSDSSSTSSTSTSVMEALPGADAELQLPKEVVERLRYTVFGFDTFWVTSVDNYERDGVVFKGNVRGRDPAATYQKLRERMRAQLGSRYRLFLLLDKEDKPTAVVLPEGAADAGTISKFTEAWLAGLFALATAVSTLDACGAPLLQFLVDPFRTELSAQDLADALPGALAFWFTLGAHEWGHRWAAAKHGVGLYTPFVVPAGFGLLGSFGGITRFRGFVPNRAALLEVAAAGPAVGAVVSTALVLLGLGLTALGRCDVGVESGTFATSLLMGTLGQAVLGEQLAQPVVQVNGLLLAGWAGLLVNALNCIPAGELDGGRIALGLWGRRPASLLGALSAGALALGSFSSSLAFYWIGLLLFLQRGPVLPCEEELSEPVDERSRWLGAALLGLPLLVLLPFPVELAVALQQLQDPTLF